jgi:hypothetical protein
MPIRENETAAGRIQSVLFRGKPIADSLATRGAKRTGAKG